MPIFRGETGRKAYVAVRQDRHKPPEYTFVS